MTVLTKTRLDSKVLKPGQFEGHFLNFQSILPWEEALKCQFSTKIRENMIYQKAPQKSYTQASWLQGPSDVILARFLGSRDKI